MALQQLKLSNSFRSLSISPGMYGRVSVDGIPKRPPSPWSSYFAKSVPSIKKKFPEMDGPALLKVASSEWAKVPEVQKSRFQALYQKEKNNYNSQLAQVPKEKMDQFKAAKKLKQLEKKKKLAEEELKNFLTRMKKPKRPTSVFFLYVAARMPNLPENLKVTEKVKVISTEWNAMDAKTKELYEDKSKEKRTKYATAYERWNRRMNKEDRDVEIALLRKKVLLIKKEIKEQEDILS